MKPPSANKVFSFRELAVVTQTKLEYIQRVHQHLKYRKYNDFFWLKPDFNV